jgi:diguanylate cyclase (GGDEF)-like protein
MNIVARQDRVLLVGLAVALFVVFAKPIRYLLDLARDVEQSYGLALVPALIILTVVFVFHLHGKRQEAKALAAAAELEARAAQAIAAEMEQLVDFGQALGRSLDHDAIRDVVVQHLPKLAGTEGAWVMLRTDDHWEGFVGTARETRRDVEQTREHMADRALGADVSWSQQMLASQGEFCLALTAGGRGLGVLGIPQTAEAVTGDRRRVVAAAAALLAISLRNAQLFHELRENGLRDGLTGCFNRTHAMEVIDTELRRARRSRLPVSVIMLDIDKFKALNDRYGHLCGDAALAAIGHCMRDVLRGSDLKCRYGGEEFLVLLPETPLDGAKRVADTLRREIAKMPVYWKGETLALTASFGVAAALPAEVDAVALVGRADAALYTAKHEGRNCVRVSAEPVVA